MKILVSGYLIRKPVAGLAYHYMQYVIGLKSLGHDVFYFEDSENISGEPSRNLDYTSKVFNYFGLEQDWSYYDFAKRCWLGPGAGKIKQFIDDCDILINVSGSIAVPEWFENVPIRIFIDTDPVFTQAKTASYPVWAYRCAEHTHHYTFGENYGSRECLIPEDGFDWRPTRQPIVLEHWSNPTTSSGKYTTIMSWKSYDPVKAKGKTYGVKDDSFQLIVELPKRTALNLEIALDASLAVHNTLADKGWHTIPAVDISQNAGTYKEYIENSFAEFTTAKSAYVESNSGWFSERSACYLAAGRPVITQNTGFTKWLECNEGGVHHFSNVDEALASAETVSSNYTKESKLARELAAEYFSSEKVLLSLVDNATASPSSTLAIGSPAHNCLHYFNKTTDTILQNIPAGEDFILMDDRLFGVFGELRGHRVIPFLEKDGQYWGQPSDSEQAIIEFTRLHQSRGVDYAVLTPESGWWPEYYSDFFQFLDKFCNSEILTSGLRIYRVKSNLHH